MCPQVTPTWAAVLCHPWILSSCPNGAPLMEVLNLETCLCDKRCEVLAQQQVWEQWSPHCHALTQVPGLIGNGSFVARFHENQ